MKLTRILTAGIGVFAINGCFLFNTNPSSSNNAASGEKTSAVPALFSGSAPTIPEAFSPLTFETSKADAEKADARFVKGGSIDESRYADASFFVSYDDDVVQYFWVSFDNGKEAAALKDMTKAWGEPTKGEHMDRPLHAWFNDDEHVIAFLEKESVEYWSYLKVSDLLGDAEPFVKPLLGKTKEELGDVYPGAKWDDDHMDLPPIKYADFPSFTRVHVEFDKGGKITEYYYGIAIDRFQDKKDEVLKAFTDKYNSDPKTEQEKYIILKQANPRIHMRFDDITKEWEIGVNRPMF